MKFDVKTVIGVAIISAITTVALGHLSAARKG